MTLLVLLLSSVSAWAFSGSGTKSDPYLISSSSEWTTFANNVNNGTTYEGMYLKLSDDIIVSTMVGSDTNKFKGNFSGDGHTLTFNLGSAENPYSQDYAAPFLYADGASFSYLHVDGDIYTEKRYVGGLISDPSGFCFITNCRISLNIHSSYDGDGTNGGIVGLNNNSDATLVFTNCLYDGKMLQISNLTNSCGGFVGWHNGDVIIKNSLVAPSAAIEFDKANSATFARNGASVTDCYYKTSYDFATKQGTDASSMSNEALLSALGSGWEIVNEKVVPKMNTGWPVVLPLYEDQEITEGTPGHYYLNMPKTGTKIVTLDDDQLAACSRTFKVYDNGGKNGEYSNSCDGTIIITAPEGNAINVNGTVYAEGKTFDFLEVYDGTETTYLLGDTKYAVNTKVEVDFTSNDRSIRLRFRTDSGAYREGINLTVSIFPLSTINNVTITNVEGGEMVADPTSAEAGETITLTATPNTGYYLSGIDVTDAAHKTVAVEWVSHSNTATFTMPGKNVTVTPTFTAFPKITIVNPAAGGTMISDPIYAFADETVTLTAIPDKGYYLSGVSVKNAKNKKIDVEWTPYTNTATFVMTATDVTITPTFAAVPTISFVNPQEGGSIVSDVTSAVPGSTVTLTATPSNGYVLNDITIMDSNNSRVNVDWTTFTNTATFTMPTTAVTITPTFTSDGNASVNMPMSGVKYVNIPSTLHTFKVYDNGGPNANYSKGREYLVLTAPEGYRLLITGKVQSFTDGDTKYHYLTLYNGIYDGSGDVPEYLGENEKWGEYSAPGQDVGKILSKEQSVTLFFVAQDNFATRSGLDLKVELVDITTPKTITINQVSGGTVVANPSPAYPLSTVTLTATPNAGKMLSGISVKDAYNNNVELDWALYDNTATFAMPGAAVTVTPTFTSIPATISVNMPTTGVKSMTMPSTTTTLKVYDDGGPDGDYSHGCDGYLKLSAPSGYSFVITGKVQSYVYDENNTQDYLTVYDGLYDGNGTAPKYIGSKEKWGYYYAPGEDIGTLASTGKDVTFYFHSTQTGYRPGMDLTVKVVKAIEYTVSTANSAAGGSIVADCSKAVANQLVTVTATPDKGNVMSAISVKDASGNEVSVDWHLFATTATFAMPASDVTITPTFRAMGDDFSVNIPAWGHLNVDVPADAKTIKVYDDGGKDGDHTPGCDGTLLLTAPEGYIMELTGTLTTNNVTCYLLVAESKDGQGQKNGTYSSSEPNVTRSFGPITTSDRYLFLEFLSTSSKSFHGFDLTVKLINTKDEFAVTVDKHVKGGLVEATPTSGKYGDGIALKATPDAGYILNGISAKDADGYDVAINGGAWYSNNTASFSMPGADVTVTPSFTNDKTANNLSVNIPLHHNTSISIPSGVRSFKVYDHGGPDGVYAAYCDGELALVAPEGCKLQLRGTMKTGTIYDKLSFYDGTSSRAALISEKTCNKENASMVETSIGTVNSKDRYMTIKFNADPASTNSEGLNLTATVVYPDAKYDINVVDNDDFGYVESDYASAKFNETITLSAHPQDHHVLSSLTVVDAYGIEVPVTWNMFENTATFVMPASAVTVTPVFAGTSPLVINMPRRNTVCATIPSGVTTLKVYDDGGEKGPFSPNTEGTLVIKAPEGCVMRVFGKMSARNNMDYFRIYNGDDTNAAVALSVTPEKDDVLENIGTFVSDGNVMTFFFLAEYNSAGRSGLNIKVDVIPVLTLADDVDNTDLLMNNIDRECNVVLGRTLQAGGWNTFCAPFSAHTPKGWTLKMLVDSKVTDDVLTLSFSDADEILAGSPYLVKVDKTVTNPVFEGVYVTPSAGDEFPTDAVTFVPVMKPTEMTGGDKSVLFVKCGNSLTYPSATATMNSFRAYFRLHDASQASRFAMDFGGGDSLTGIITVGMQNAADSDRIFDLQGRRVTQLRKGAYIKNGKLIINK